MIVSILGIIGAGGPVSAILWARELNLLRRFLQLTGSEALEIIAPSIDSGNGRPNRNSCSRSLVSASNIEAAVIVATAGGALRPKKGVQIWLSENTRVRVESDLSSSVASLRIG